MSLCRHCTNSGLCVILQQLKEQTILEFPDGKVAIVEMESALLSCDHHVPLDPTAAADYGYIGDNQEFADSPAYEPAEAPYAAAAQSESTPAQRRTPQAPQGPAWTKDPPITPDEGEVITYGPDGPQVATAGNLPGLFDGGEGSAKSGRAAPQRLNLTNLRGLGGS